MIVLILRSIGTGTTNIFSFITFTLIGDSIESVGDTGYINGPWYEPVDSISDTQILEVKEHYDNFMKERLNAIESSKDKNRAKQDKYRKDFSKPDYGQ